MFRKHFDHNLLAETPSPYGETLDDYMSHIHRLNGELSGYTKEILGKLKATRIKHYQFLDIPVTEEIPLTATEYIPGIPKNSFQSEGIIGAVSLELGRMFSYRETSEFLMYDIYPVKQHEYTRSFVNSRKMLSFHTDGSAHPHINPDYVLLFCIRHDRNAANLFVDVETLIEKLSPEVIDTLARPLFRHLVSQSPEYYSLMPVLYREGNSFTIRYDEDNTFGIDPEAVFAQQCLNEMLRESAIKIRNYSNSLLVLNNKNALHARTSFTPRYDGKDRWIKCAFVTTREIENGSIFDLDLPEISSHSQGAASE